MTSQFKHPHTLMVQGTTSDAGKSILVTALCRILHRHGISVAPFKPQNMALNSAVTPDGGEIGRAQAVQAEACGLEPSVEMNPVLLKPNSDMGAQVIVLGKTVGNWQAQGYHGLKPKLLDEVLGAHEALQTKYEVVMVEGAGSPAEINLRENDIANMGFAEPADCPVIIVADIDRGGVFAHLFGTYELLSETEKARVKGFVINRFRGDIKLLESGLDWLEEKTGVPVLGVIPYLMDLHIEAEDALNFNQVSSDSEKLKVVIPVYPRASNHTDFDVLRLHPNIDCQLVRQPKDMKEADLIILPGSKNVRGDLQWLKDQGWVSTINKHLRYGGKVLGICGGFQMLGQWIHDPDGIESAPGSSEGLGLLKMETTLTPEKMLRNVEGHSVHECFLGKKERVKGYEIHAGRSEGLSLEQPLFDLMYASSDQSDSDTHNNVDQVRFTDGAMNEDQSVMGTYIHGVLDETNLLQWVMKWSGLDSEQAEFDYQAFRQREFDRLADAVEEAIPLAKLKTLLSLNTQ